MTSLIQVVVNTFEFLRRAVLWIPGLYAGFIVALFTFLIFSGGEFIAGKVLFLALVLFPLFAAGAVGCMKSGIFTLSEFFRSSTRYYFPVLLPAIVIIAIIILLMILLSVPFALAGFGNDPSMIGGLFIGITISVLISSFFYDNAAVTEDLKIFISLKRSMVIASHSFLTIIFCLILTAFTGLVLSVGAAMVWGIFLVERFTPYLEMSMAEQQQVFSTFDLAKWQEILGPSGIAVTAVMMGLYVMILLTWFIVLKHQCFLSVHNREIPSHVPPVGEYDEKGRWYKY